jgi:hypothetical protein
VRRVRTDRAICDVCPAEILWARTARGKWLPLDARPFARDDVGPSGRWRLDRGPEGGHRAVHDDIAVNGARVYVAHFATCPGRQPARPGRADALAARRDEYARAAGTRPER